MRGGKREGAGRKPDASAGRREHKIQICLSTSELIQIKRAAQNAGANTSGYMRDIAIKQAIAEEFDQYLDP